MEKHDAKEKFLAEEWRRIRKRRRVAFELEEQEEGVTKDPDGPPKDLVGLSLSGGGLRSAIFNDGFLQGLSHRGMLRYIDYLSSVSGGGYIASHLAVQKPPTGSKNFHADSQPQGVDEVPDEPWHLGRDPTNGQWDPKRMAGVGQYLAQPLKAGLCYATGFITNALVYVGFVGVLATLAALFWRSFDDTGFRYMLTTVLEFRFGDELMIAFYPTILVGIAWIGLFLLKHFLPDRRAVGQGRILRFIDRCFGWSGSAFVLSIPISIAVFLGNGKTFIKEGGGDDPLILNQYAMGFVIGAAILQIIAFFGRDHLFKSEKAEAKHWQQAGQKLSTFGVVLAALFAMVHWMAREDISHFTRYRSDYLVMGDVSNWAWAQSVFKTQPIGNVDAEGTFQKKNWYPPRSMGEAP